MHDLKEVFMLVSQYGGKFIELLKYVYYINNEWLVMSFFKDFDSLIHYEVEILEALFKLKFPLIEPSRFSLMLEFSYHYHH